MSIVGPRPERPEIAAEYEKEMPEFRLRLQARWIENFTTKFLSVNSEISTHSIDNKKIIKI